ncbi:Uncharacterized protein HZ326_31510 [Fusarium oxysporum f. sp. albedinis]|nr:Uncharacterized protein HZ326_31510 [Fusarium oxysporum f. sp. albedinis]
MNRTGSGNIPRYLNPPKSTPLHPLSGPSVVDYYCSGFEPWLDYNSWYFSLDSNLLHPTVVDSREMAATRELPWPRDRDTAIFVELREYIFARSFVHIMPQPPFHIIGGCKGGDATRGAWSLNNSASERQTLELERTWLLISASQVKK